MADLEPERNPLHPINRISPYLSGAEQSGMPLRLEDIEIYSGRTSEDPAWLQDELIAKYDQARAALLALLKTDMTPAVQRELSQTLQEIHDPQITRELIGVLEDRSVHYEIRVVAAQSLAGKKDPWAQRSLAKIVADPYAAKDYYGCNSRIDPEMSIRPHVDHEKHTEAIIAAAAKSLTGVSDEEAIDTLCKGVNPSIFNIGWYYALGFTQKEIAEKRAKCAAVLAGTPSQKGQEALVTLLCTGGRALRRIAAESLSGLHNHRAEKIILKAAKKTVFTNQAELLGGCLQGTPHSDIRDGLISLLTHHRPLSQRMALVALKGTDREHEVQAICSLMNNTDDPDIYALCIAAISPIKSQTAENTMIEHLKKADDESAFPLIEALSNSNHYEAIVLKFKFLTGRDPLLCEAAGRSFEANSDHDLQSKLLTLITLDDGIETRHMSDAAARALQKVKAPETIEELCSILRDWPDSKKIRAAKALRFTESEEAAAALLQVAREASFSNEVRLEAIDALSTFEGDVVVLRRIQKGLAKLLMEEGVSRDIRLRTVQTLKNPQHPLALATLSKLLKSENVLVRTAAINALGSSSIVDAQETLTKHMQKPLVDSARVNYLRSAGRFRLPIEVDAMIQGISSKDGSIRESSVAGLREFMASMRVAV